MRILKSILLIIVLAFGALAMGATKSMKQEYKEFQKAGNEKVEVLEDKLDKMKDKVSKMSGDAKEEMHERYEELVEYKDDLKDRLSKLSEASSESWVSVKSKINQMTLNLESRVDKSIN